MHDDPVRSALLLLVLSACGRLGFDPTTALSGDDALDDAGTGDGTGDGDGGVDAEIDAAIDAPAGACVQPGSGCTFPGGLPCSCWGTPSTVNAGMNEAGGSLKITPNANTVGAQGSCVRASTTFSAAGAIIEISQVVAGAQGLTAIQLGGGGDVHQLAVQGGQLIAQDATGTINMAAYNPVSMRWWRIRPVAVANTLYETSADGVTFTPFVTSTKVGSSSYTVRIIGGTIGGVAAPGFAQIESINLCGP